jgi:hypothetical protein
LSLTTDYIDCSEDGTLMDNSSGTVSESICGADRYKISFNTAQITGTTSYNNDLFQKVIKFGLSGSTFSVQYINGLTI